MLFKREGYIYSKLEEHYNAVTNEYEVFGVFLQGSQNYGLDIYTEEYMSDIDSKAIILPSLEDIVEGRRLVSAKITMKDNSLIDVKDIRAICEQWQKQNPSYLEILFTEFFIINPKYNGLFEELKLIRRDIAAINSYDLHRSIFGMSIEKRKALKHPYPSILDKIEKYGYDRKAITSYY